MNSPLPKYAEQEELVQFNDEGQRFQLHPDALKAWKRMKNKAKTQGIELFIVSAFRNIERQSEIIEAKKMKGVSDEDIFKVSAPPGFSEHHTGKAVDINTNGFPPFEEHFEKSDAFRWLSVNAKDFGFHLSYPKKNKYGIAYEPWHWFYDGEAQQGTDDNSCSAEIKRDGPSNAVPSWFHEPSFEKR